MPIQTLFPGTFWKNLAYLLRDVFTTAASAPLSSPRTSEPGPGTLTIVQNDGQFSISSGALQFPAQATPTFGDLGWYDTSGKSRVCGRSAIATFNFTTRSNAALLCWLKSAKVFTGFADISDGAFLSGAASYVPSRGSSAPTLASIITANSTPYQIAVVLRTAGAWHVVKTGTGSWTLVWVGAFTTDATLYLSFSNFASVGTIDDLGIRDLGGVWSTPFGFANWIEFPSAGATLEAPSTNSFVECVWIPQSSETFELSIRRTDSNNRWILRCSQSGSTIKLIELNAGSETERSSQAQTFTVATQYRIIARPSGNAIALFVESLLGDVAARGSFTSTFNNTATGVSVGGFANARNFAVWPTNPDPFSNFAFLANKPASGTIDLINPQPNQVVQRTGASNNSIEITGSHNMSGTRTIEARWSGGSWQSIATGVAAGSFTGTLTGLGTGDGTLDIRIADATTVTATAANVGIGEVFVIAGQSNAVGQGTNNQSYTGTSGYFRVFSADFRAKQLSTDPTCSTTNGVDTVSLTSALGSIWPLVANSFVANQNVPIMFVPCALNGSSITQWDPPTVPQNRTTLFGSMDYRVARNVGDVRAVLWWQGEADALAGQTQAFYYGKLVTLATTVNTNLGCKIMPCKLQVCTGITDSNTQRIRDATVQAWTNNSNVVLTGPDLSGLTTNDSFHLTSDTNLSDAATLWWNAIKTAFGW